MILETSQILCTVLNEKGFNAPYKSTHKNHPCVKWAGKSFGNFEYLVDLLYSLNAEYEFRYNKCTSHLSFIKITEFLNSVSTTTTMYTFDQLERTPFVQCMPDQYRCNDPVQAYRNYYIGEKQHIAKWTKRPVPKWFIFKNDEKSA
jgi:hypothetical protein